MSGKPAYLLTIVSLLIAVATFIVTNEQKLISQEQLDILKKETGKQKVIIKEKVIRIIEGRKENSKHQTGSGIVRPDTAPTIGNDRKTNSAKDVNKTEHLINIGLQYNSCNCSRTTIDGRKIRLGLEVLKKSCASSRAKIVKCNRNDNNFRHCRLEPSGNPDGVAWKAKCI